MFSRPMQLVIALACVAAALAFLVVRVQRWWRGRGAGCHGCPGKQNGDTRVIPLDLKPALDAKRGKDNLN